MVGRKKHGVGGVRGDPLGRFPQAPEVCICRSAAVTPAGVGIRAAVYPGHWRRLWPSGEGAVGDLCAGYIRGTGEVSTGARVHLPASETGRIGPYKPNSDGP